MKNLLLLLAVFPAFSVLLSAEERVEGDPGNIRIRYLPIPREDLNLWTPAEEEGFWKRANEALARWNPGGKYGNTYFENEKASYPNAFIDFLKGNREAALKFLETDDADPHARKATLAVDWYPSFTIKSQVRKYFFFGQYLDPAYRKRMFDSAKLWTEVDPLNRPNDFFQGKKEGWNVESKNSWVDVRNTDNLRAMRECAVYLMAEETGNQATASAYRERIRAYVTALYSTGMGEWDSANYMAHTVTGYLQLYDFAKDPGTRLLAKGALDWLSAAAAVKYFRGNWAGPDKRDYTNIPIFEGAPGTFWIYFGDTPKGPADPHSDLIHFITSPYRPPPAVAALAKKDFPRPVEILSSKPSYEGWYRKPGGEDAPEFYETNFISEGFQLGTLPTGHVGDACGFRMASSNSSTGSDIWILSTALKGYAGGFATATSGGDQTAQFRNLVISANPNGNTPFHFMVPKSAEITTRDGVTFFKAERAWVAVTRVGVKPGGVDAAATAEVCSGKRPCPDNQIWTALGEGAGPAALILEVGDASVPGGFEAFQRAVLEKSRADLSKLSAGEIHYTGSSGAKVGIRLNPSGLPVVFRDGAEHDWSSHNALYACAPGSRSAPISLGWKQGILKVDAGGKSFTGILKDGKYSFENR